MKSTALTPVTSILKAVEEVNLRLRELKTCTAASFYRADDQIRVRTTGDAFAAVKTALEAHLLEQKRAMIQQLTTYNVVYDGE